MEPLISVILPIYNVEKYIRECLDSILNQTLQDFEVLVIDDCSDDNTLEVIKSFNDERIYIIEKEVNKGLIDSLNRGFKVARGKYIARVDGDDINALDRFEKQFNFLNKNKNIAACGCWLQNFGKNDTIIKHQKMHNEIQVSMLLSNSMSLGASMLRRSSYQNFKFNGKMLHVEDYDFWARTLWVCKLHNLQEVLYHYRVHEQQVSLLFKKEQVANDISIKLNLFKKINYNQDKYSEKLLTRIMYSSEYFNIRELHLFMLWTKRLLKNNTCYDDKLFKQVINRIIRNLVYSIYFKGNRKSINKFWRLKALFVLPFKEFVFIIRKKIK
ncbi:MAG: glycosyltransferase involved in cell wall biosynthesis [Polaribacter sp.]|jgi:glycosyltransferase involved in cell wall biosynthesis|tara:strand:- start:176 stop:1156 length:981 start_codon:yes stop_codon:yes gene_type:complete